MAGRDNIAAYGTTKGRDGMAINETRRTENWRGNCWERDNKQEIITRNETAL